MGKNDIKNLKTGDVLLIASKDFVKATRCIVLDINVIRGYVYLQCLNNMVYKRISIDKLKDKRVMLLK